MDVGGLARGDERNRRSLQSALSKNISRKGPLNCRSLGCARDDKGDDGAFIEHWLVDERTADPLGPAVSAPVHGGRDRV